MIQFFSDFTEIFSAVFELPVFRFALCLLPFTLFPYFFRTIFQLLDVEPDPPGFFFALWEWLADKVITWLCRTEKGFYLAYKLGWARQGVEYFDCGIDCYRCPKYDGCDCELRVPLDDVTQKQDPGAGS